MRLIDLRRAIPQVYMYSPIHPRFLPATKIKKAPNSDSEDK